MSHTRRKRKAPRVLSLLALLAAVLGPQAARAQRSVTSCAAACERHVKDPALRARVCNRCLLLGDARGGWLEGLAAQTPFPAAAVTSALEDPDWMVAREASKVLAAQQRTTQEATLASWLGEADGPRIERACVSIARIGADRGLTLTKWRKRLSDGGGRHGRKAFSQLARCEAKIRGALELELYGMDRAAQLEALRHLATLFGYSPAHAVLDAMRSRPDSTAPIAAKALLLDAEEGGMPVGLALLRAATKQNQHHVNLLVALYAEDVKKIAPRRAAADPMDRRGVVRELKAYAPLSAPELEAMLTDEDLLVRTFAANALAKGEGRTLEEAVQARLKPKKDQPALAIDAQARWLRLLGESGSKGCGTGVARDLAEDLKADPVLRSAAIEALGNCGGKPALRVVLGAMDSGVPIVRAAAVTALENLPRSAPAKNAARAALLDKAPEVQAAAAKTVAAHRQTHAASEIATLLDSSAAPVRAAAARALGTLSSRAHLGALAQKLKSDPDRDVRIAAAEALGDLGGPQAVGALSEAANKDPESRVRYIAEKRLRALGFSR